MALLGVSIAIEVSKAYVQGPPTTVELFRGLGGALAGIYEGVTDLVGLGFRLEVFSLYEFEKGLLIHR